MVFNVISNWKCALEASCFSSHPSSFPSRFISITLFLPVCFLLRFLSACSPESCSSGCTTSYPAKLINMVYVIDPSACLVYTVCAHLSQKETLNFHTQGSWPSLSRIIVQLTSQSQPIMWEGFAGDSGEKQSGLCESGWWGGGKNVFLWCSRPYNFIAPGGGLKYHGRQRQCCAASVLWINRFSDLVTCCSSWSALEFKDHLWSFFHRGKV